MKSCPKILPPETTDNYLIHINYTYTKSPLNIRAENLDLFSTSFSSGEYRCVIHTGPYELFATAAALKSDRTVECILSRVS